jgi:hypothetical protein
MGAIGQLRVARFLELDGHRSAGFLVWDRPDALSQSEGDSR